ncbi:MAG: hypothetical protein K8I30_23485 [Anaerolineae bacterium]|nr:hypothetical protein [Anaerolineae bacterium]
MTTFDPISLDLLPVTSHVQSGGSIHLQCTFDLDPIGEVCLRFVLHIDAAPVGTTVDLNRWHMSITPENQPFIADVTDFVTLEDNVLLLQLRETGMVGAVWLERVPCETA